MNSDSKNLFTNQDYLTNEQYKNASNLNTRIDLHRLFSTNPQDFKAWEFSIITKLIGKGRLLVLGCGPADLWQENAKITPEKWEIVLSDLSPGMLETARENLFEIPIEFQFEVIDAQHIPFDDHSFIGVTANHMLYHVPDIEKAVSEIHRVLKPGGTLVAATNGRNHMAEVRELVLSIDPQANMQTAADFFGLENGLDLLKQYFPEVSVLRFEDGLTVTEMKPLLDYILSMKRSDKIMKYPALAAEKITREIETKGAFSIQKDVGVFVATKP